MIKVFDKFIFDSIESFGIKPLGFEWSYLDDLIFHILLSFCSTLGNQKIVGKSILRIFENFEVFF